jgi:hypothetical protein
MELDSRGQHRTVASSEHRNHFVFLLKVSPAEIARTHRTREEFVPHCSENWRRGLQWEQWAVVRLMWEELLRHGMSPGEIRACYRLLRLIAGRTARPSLGISVICERCLHRWLLSCSLAALWWDAEAIGLAAALR